jgi:hypothetical protein
MYGEEAKLTAAGRMSLCTKLLREREGSPIGMRIHLWAAVINGAPEDPMRQHGSTRRRRSAAAIHFATIDG